jgi:hypothetical protein
LINFPDRNYAVYKLMIIDRSARAAGWKSQAHGADGENAEESVAREGPRTVQAKSAAVATGARVQKVGDFLAREE